jgi:hypothetical protein
MAFLDELKKEAQALQEHEQSLTQARAMEVTQSFLRVQLKLKAIQQYLQELAKTLNVVAQASPRTYYIDGFGTIEDYRAERFVVNTERLTIEERDFINSVLLRFTCRTGKEILIEKQTSSAIDLQREYLWKANIKFECTDFKNEKGVIYLANFKVASEIPVFIKFTADFEKGKIFLSIKNLNGLVSSEFTYDADEIDEALLDEFAKCVVGKPNTFTELGRFQQSKKQKVVVKRGVDETEYTKLAPHLEEKLDRAASEVQPEAKKGLFGALKSFLTKG